jgi:hypothetical protein
MTPAHALPRAPCFHQGFCFGFNIAIVINLIQEGNWAVIESDEAGTFAFVSRKIVSIQVDPTDEFHYLSFRTDDDSRVSARSWQEIFEILQVTRESALPGQPPDPVQRFPRMRDSPSDPGISLFSDQSEGFPFDGDIPEPDC